MSRGLSYAFMREWEKNVLIRSIEETFDEVQEIPPHGLLVEDSGRLHHVTLGQDMDANVPTMRMVAATHECCIAAMVIQMHFYDPETQEPVGEAVLAIVDTLYWTGAWYWTIEQHPDGHYYLGERLAAEAGSISPHLTMLQSSKLPAPN